MQERGPSAYAAECIGTFMLVLFVSLIFAVNSRTGIGVTDFAVIGLVHTFVLMLIVASIGGVSGAHVNPAVTVALCALRKISLGDAVRYVLAQLLGALLAALVAKALLQNDAGELTKYGAAFVSDTVLGGSRAAGFAAEALGTFMLMWAIMATAVDPRAPKAWAPLIIGATLGMAVMTIGPLTGASFNPARAFGPALVSGDFGGAADFVVVYVFGAITGALLAAASYTAVVLVPQERH